MIHRINIFLLSLFVAFAPTYIFASTLAGSGWSVSKQLVQGATTTYNGVKNVVLNGKNYAATGVATVTPTAAQVGKMIVRTGAVLAVDLAIKALIGSVDYVMDPANNQVKYTVVKDPNSTYVYQVIDRQVSSPDAACNYYYSKQSYTEISDKNTLVKNGGASVYCSAKIKYSCMQGTSTCSTQIAYEFYRVAIVEGDKEEKTLSYDAVAAQVISDAMAEKAEGKAYVSSVADTALSDDENQQIVGADVVAQQLNNSQSIPTNGTATGTSTPTSGTGDPAAPPAPPSNITINFPVFCGWAPTVCQAAQAAIEFPKTFIEKFTKWDDWINRETKPYSYDDTKLNTEDKRTFDFSIFSQNRFNVDDQCPMPETTTLNVLGIQTAFSFDLKPICSILEMAKPALIACSYIYAAYIVIGASKGG